MFAGQSVQVRELGMVEMERGGHGRHLFAEMRLPAGQGDWAIPKVIRNEAMCIARGDILAMVMVMGTMVMRKKE